MSNLSYDVFVNGRGVWPTVFLALTSPNRCSLLLPSSAVLASQTAVVDFPRPVR